MKRLPSFFFVQPTEEIALDVAARLTPMDALEARLMSGMEPCAAMLESIRASEESGGACLACVVEGRAELICGAAPYGLLGDSGQVWMLHTDVPARHGLLFAKYSRQILAKLFALSGCARLENCCLAENAASIRWLKWLGFVFDQDAAVQGHTWRHFFKEVKRGDCC